MSIPGAGSPLFLSAAAAEAAAFQVDRSLRFNSGDTSNLSKTFSSAGNRKTWTWSCWYKRSVLGTKNQRFFSCLTGSDDNTYLELRSFDNDTICLSGYATNFRVTDAEILDPSAWYHLVVACDTTQSSNSDRVKLYINGVQQTFSTEATITQNANLGFNQAEAHQIGNAFDGYLAEIHFVDGTQLAASDFGEYDDNNNWNPKDCQSSLTYGTNGFYLKFADNSSASNLGTDSSGNSNTWTVNNLSVASGSGNDSLLDTPTNYTPDSGNPGGNYATFSPIDSHSSNTFANGNLEATNAGVAVFANLTMGFTSGKWYCEIEADGGGASSCMVGVCDLNQTHANRAYGTTGGLYMYQGTGGLYSGGLGGSFSNGSYGSAYSDGDIIGIGLDMDNGNVLFYINGSDQGQANTSSLAGALVSPAVNNDTNTASFTLNTGARPFVYTPPTGHKAICTTNFADLTIAEGSTAMNATAYTGNGSTQAVTGLNHSPDFAWIKHRTRSQSHVIYDIVRGAGTGKSLSSNSAGEEGGADDGTVYGYLSAFGSDGFTVIDGSDAEDYVNKSGAPYIAWTWDGGTSTASNTDGSITTNVRANASAGFSIIGFTGNATVGATIGHGLNSKPEFFTIKLRDSEANWYTYHQAYGATKYTTLDRTHAAASNTYLNDTEPTSSVITLNNTFEVNGVNEDVICYAWTSVAGYSSFGSYEGNGSNTGPFVFLGFRPRWVLIRPSSTTGNWFIHDSARDTYNPVEEGLRANLANVTSTTGDRMTFLSNGFRITKSNADMNGSGVTFIYAAFAEHPFKTARAR